MTTPANLQDLSLRIEQVIQEHMTASRMAASEAIERAFAGSASTTKRKSSSTPRNVGRRRTKDEMVDLARRLYQAVCAKPGESMLVLAANIGATPRELNRPMAHLKRAGKVRSVGERHLTRYFPLVSEAASL